MSLSSLLRPSLEVPEVPETKKNIAFKSLTITKALFKVQKDDSLTNLITTARDQHNLK